LKRILEAVESSERAYDNGDLEEIRHTAAEFLEELERH
jgi:hypothetical protein